jgi:hypothetical protein
MIAVVIVVVVVIIIASACDSVGAGQLGKTVWVVVVEILR